MKGNTLITSGHYRCMVYHWWFEKIQQKKVYFPLKGHKLNTKYNQPEMCEKVKAVDVNTNMFKVKCVNRS